ncbi:hypothetical protein BGZ76_008794 [Entomortierella beljakovae]|nr:hypothetical protein BGZ76_008794 [Entomortierella beljakovae]
MTSPRRPHHLIPALVLAFALLAFSSSNLAHANIFGSTVAKLRFDIISVRDRPTSIDQADDVSPGNDIPAGVILKTGGIPKEGLSGVLFDLGYGCSTTFDPNNTLPTPEFYGLPKIALIQRGGPTEEQACTFRAKLLNAKTNGSIAAIIYTYPGMDTIDNATAALDSSETPLDIPGLMITYESGMDLKSFLGQTIGDGIHDFNNRVRVTMSSEQKLPVVWEFVLIIVVVLLAVAFTVSVVLHCRLYALRQRIRMDALSRGADVLPNGTIRMRKITLDKAILNELPVRVYGQEEQAPSTPRLPTTAGVGASSVPSLSQKEEALSSQQSNKNEIVPNTENQSNTHIIRRSSSLSSSHSSSGRANSLKGSISGRSAKSLKAAAALTASTTEPTSSSLISPAAAANTPNPIGDMEEEACAVCLDEFSDGEEIRTLPCRHEFHCECIDPWLTRKSSLCPLCKYDCMPQTVEEAEGRGEDSNIVVPNDRFIEFIMGHEWVTIRTSRGHNGSSYVDRMGHFFGTMYDRARRRPQRPFPGPTVSSSSRRRRAQQISASNQVIPLDDNGQVPLQIITPHGVSIAPTTEVSSESAVEPSLVPAASASQNSIPVVAIDIAENLEPSISAQQESIAESSTTQSISKPPVAIDIPADEEKK